jgi:hypothetical protein
MRTISARSIAFAAAILIGTALNAVAAPPGRSETLTVLKTTDGPLIQGLFDVNRYGAGSVIAPTAGATCSGQTSLTADWKLDDSITGAVPLVACTTGHCFTGGQPLGCVSMMKPVTSEVCETGGCNNNHCQDVTQPSCCVMCTQPYCACHTPGYCTN